MSRVLIWIAIIVVPGCLLLMLPTQTATAQSCGSCPSFCDYVPGSGQYPADYCRWPSTGCRVGDADNGGCCVSATPLIIDLASNGFSLTSGPNGVPFDLNNDQITEQLAWTAAGSDDAWLVLDRNENGNIDSGVEMFTNYSPQERKPRIPPNGFLALAEFDQPENGGNGDGTINASDAIYGKLRLWTDRNHNGTVDEGELSSLEDNSILGIDLEYRNAHRVDEFGNTFKYRAKLYTRNDNGPAWIWDVYLVRD